MRPTVRKAAKTEAIIAVKQGVKLLASITPEQRRQLTAESTEVADALRDVRHALAGGGAPFRRRRRWGKLRATIVNPKPEVVIARKLRLILEEHGPQSASALAELAGTTTEDEDFTRALEVALDDGRIVATDDRLTAPTAETLLEEHPLLRQTGQVEHVERRVVESIHAVGVMTRDELSSDLGVVPAGLEQALAAGVVEWLGDGFYAVPADAVDLVEQRMGGDRVGPALRRLGAATATLGRRASALRSGQAKGDGEQPVLSAPDLLALKLDDTPDEAPAASRNASSESADASWPAPDAESPVPAGYPQWTAGGPNPPGQKYIGTIALPPGLFDDPPDNETPEQQARPEYTEAQPERSQS